MNERPHIVACIPAFNEEKTIGRVVLLAQRYADKVVVCDDGSRDMTAEIAEKLGAEVVRHGRNLGYGAALRSLFGRARELGADVLVTLDGDGQHDPAEIKAVAGPILSGEADIVVGSRFLGENNEVRFYRGLGIKSITGLTGRAAGNSFSDAQSGFRAYNKKAIEGLRLTENGMGVSTEVLLRGGELGLRVVEVPVGCSYLTERLLTEDAGVLQGLNLAIVIPALNEAESIGRVLDEVFEVLKGEKFTVVVVDGRSTDGTDEIARRKGAIVIYQRNNGYGDALKTGFLYAKKYLHANVIVMMDADLTYDAKDIPRLVEPVLKGEADLIVGNRFAGMQEGAMPFVNRVGNRLLSGFARATLRLKVHDTQCGLRAFRSELVDSLDLETEGMPLATELLSEAKFARARISEVPVAYRRRVGVTKLNPLRDGLRILGTIIRLMRDTEPLLFFGAIGFVLGVVGLWFGIDVTLEWLRTGSAGRVPTVMLSVLLLMGAMQFFTMGLVADMIKGLRRSKN